MEEDQLLIPNYLNRWQNHCNDSNTCSTKHAIIYSASTDRGCSTARVLLLIMESIAFLKKIIRLSSLAHRGKDYLRHNRPMSISVEHTIIVKSRPAHIRYGQADKPYLYFPLPVSARMSRKRFSSLGALLNPSDAFIYLYKS